MQVSKSKLRNGVLRARELLNDSRVFVDTRSGGQISIDGLQAVVHEHRGIPVKVHDVAFDAANIRGRMERYTTHIDIHIRRNMDSEWKRIVTAKELLHAIIDDDEDCTPYGNLTLEELVAEGRIGHLCNESTNGKPVQSEWIAEVAAIELMYPNHYRVDDERALSRGEASLSHLALRFDIPEMFIETALQPSYRRAIASALEAEE